MEPRESNEVETDRLEALRRYDILYTPPDGAFDRVASLARRWFGTPIALVSLVDHDRIWFKARAGLEAPEICREPGLCSSVVTSDQESYVVTDALTDPRTMQNSLVTGELGLRFYAAAPIVVEGQHRLGTVCVAGHEPREVSDEEREVLQDLAAIVVHEMELRLATRDRARLLLDRAETVRRRSLGRVALGLSHDLSNRLQSATTLLEEVAASDGLDRPMARSMREVLRRLAETAELTGPVAAMGTREATMTPPLDLNARLKRLLPLLEASAEGRVRERDLRSTASVAVLAYDFDLILEVLYAAALSQSDAGVPIRIVCEDARHPELPGERGAALRIIHAGRLRDETLLARLRDPLDAATAGADGMELPIMASLVHRLGGMLDVRTEDGQTEWLLWLPARVEAPTVLVVEDDDLVRGALTRALQTEYEVAAFSTPLEALEWSRKSHAGALIADQNLPAMSGVELARELRRSNPALPVMIVTGYRLEGALDKGFAFLRKPFSMDELRRWLSDTIELRTVADA